VFRIICFWPVNKGRVSHASSLPRLVTVLITPPLPVFSRLHTISMIWNGWADMYRYGLGIMGQSLGKPDQQWA
jgi:hypothetical protein